MPLRLDAPQAVPVAAAAPDAAAAPAAGGAPAQLYKRHRSAQTTQVASCVRMSECGNTALPQMQHARLMPALMLHIRGSYTTRPASSLRSTNTVLVAHTPCHTNRKAD